MFESNTDLEFDEIFGGSFQPEKSEAPKRTFEIENSSDEANKKLCVDRKMSVRSMTFLRKIDKSPNNITFEAQPTPLVISPRLQSKSASLFSPLRQNSFNNTPMKKVVLRKFPGPAGLLPERKGFNIKALEEVNSKETKQGEIEICSQLSVKAFREGPWEQMSKDFSSSGLNRVMFLPDKYNIAWIKAKMKSNKLINQKAPFLAAIVEKIECLKLKTPVVTMILKDATGQIHGTIIHDLYEEYINVLKVGSVVILKQFGVLTTDNGSNHYLTITANNLVAIYSEETTNQSDSTAHEEHNFNEVNVTVIQKLSVKDFLKNIHEVKSRHKAAFLEQRLNPGMDFGSVHLNLKPMSEGSLSARRDFAQMQTNENKNIQRDQFIALNYRNGNARNLSCSNINNNAKSDSNLSINSKIAPSCSNSSGSPANLNKENNVGLLNSSSNSKQRFNFKTHNLNKQNDVLHPSIISKSFLESKSYSTTAGPKNQIVTNSLNANKSECLAINENNRIVSQPMSNNNDSVVKCSQISISSDSLEHNAILQNLFEGVDADLLFEDF